MAAEKFDFGEFLAVLEAKHAALEALINSYRMALSMGALGDIDVTTVTATNVNRMAGGSIDLPQGALLGKSLPAAIQLYMSAARKKLTTKEIVMALKEGGVESTSQNFDNTVTTALHRLKTAGAVLKFNDGWGLAEFYPENMRSRIAAQSEKGAKRATPKRRKATKKEARLLSLPPATAEPKQAAG